MNLYKLSLDTIPPILTPFRFFLTAPLFAILASILLLYMGDDIWLNRWQNNNLALIHLLTIGFMLMVMMGALYQFIPVMNGQLVPGSKTLAPVIHLFMVLGVLTLVAGFLYTSRIFSCLSLLLLGTAVSLFALALVPLLMSRLGAQLIVFLLRVLFFVLIITLGLGLFMLLGHAAPELKLPFRVYTDIHAMWGLIGWVVLLILAILPVAMVFAKLSSQYPHAGGPAFFVEKAFGVTAGRTIGML